MAEVVLTPAQQVAFDTLLPVLKRESKQHVAVLEGFAGTGKSFLVAQLLAVSVLQSLGETHLKVL